MEDHLEVDVLEKESGFGARRSAFLQSCLLEQPDCEMGGWADWAVLADCVEKAEKGG